MIGGDVLLRRREKEVVDGEMIGGEEWALLPCLLIVFHLLSISAFVILIS